MSKFVLKELIRELKTLITCLKLNIINMRAGRPLVGCYAAWIDG